MHWLLDSGAKPTRPPREREVAFFWKRWKSSYCAGSSEVEANYYHFWLSWRIRNCTCDPFFFSDELEFLKMKKRCGSLADIFEPPRKGFLCSNGIFWNLLCLYNFFYSFCPHPPLFRIQSTKKVFWLIAFDTILLQCTVWWPCYWFFGLCRCGRQESIVGGNSQEDTGQHTQWDQLIAQTQFSWIWI